MTSGTVTAAHRIELPLPRFCCGCHEPMMQAQQTAEKVSNHRASNDEVNFRIHNVAFPVGGALVGLVLREPSSGNFALVAGSDRIDELVSSDVTAAALAAVVAVAIVTCLSKMAAAVGSVAAGALLLAVPLLFPTAVGLYFNGVGAGLVLGGLLGLARAGAGHARWSLAAVATGVVLGSLDLVSSVPRRYADYMTADHVTSGIFSGWDIELVVVWILLVVTVALAVSFLVEREAGASCAGKSVDIRAAIVGLGVPIVALVVHWLYVSATWDLVPFSDGWQILGAATAVTGVVAVAALWLPRSTGLVLVTGLAVASVGVNPTFVHSRGWIAEVAVIVAAAALAFAAGRRWPMPVLGIVALGALAVAALEFDDLTAPLFPIVAAYAFAAGAPPSNERGDVSAVAVPGVLAVALFVRPFSADFGWTAYTPLTSASYTSSTSTGWTGHAASTAWTVVHNGSGVASIAVCAAVAWFLVRRTTRTESA